ncbi:hypothetical protein DE146DRAFT_186573 [Phaeosphaeria sp. MPI-PUGE-AT-0046c]|nr:hypothetical protein DE146DRAFT_186573 [Phaeosphaeria sp. MPI-PUGE-AT-0046c]
MVGVPGRSKGCQTCRKRRVKCDEGKPVCNRCTRAGFECLGYERERIWRNTSTVPCLDSEMSSSQAHDVAIATPQQAIQIGRVRSPTPPPELSLVAFRDNIYLSLMFSNHVWRASAALWLEDAATGKLGRLSMDSAYALSQANFGRVNRQHDIEIAGTALYGQCLKTLAGRLANIDQDGQALLVPILLLLMHAASQADQTGAVFHLRGIARLLHVCGPEAFQEQPLLSAFEGARAIQMIAALFGRQRLFLESDQWRTVSWLLHPACKTPQSELMDILVLVPGILQDYASLESSDFISQVQLQELQARVETQLILLYQWRWQWQTRSAHEVGADTTFPQSYPTATEPTLRLRFRRFVVASELMLYNATLMWLTALLFKINPNSGSNAIQTCATTAMPAPELVASTSFYPLWLPGGTFSLREPALEICRTFEWVARHHNSSREPTYLYLFPVGMAMTALQDDAEALAWIKALLHTSPATASYALGANQAGFGFYLSREAFATPGIIQVQGDLFTTPDIELFSAMSI